MLYKNESILSKGYSIVSNVIDCDHVAKIIAAIEALPVDSNTHARTSVYAMRNLLESVPEISSLAVSDEVRRLVTPVLGESAFAVRGILFDKTPDANWKVVWHQDLSIAVRDRIETLGYGPWSVKDGVVHVQPPVTVLENMLTVRIHLDHCNSSNGALRVLPGSHTMGRLKSEQIAEYRVQIDEIICEVPAGGALVMRPLLLHASSSAITASHRRVVHIEYAASDLLGRLEWHTRRKFGQ